jgi:hypothetical protein
MMMMYADGGLPFCPADVRMQLAAIIYKQVSRTTAVAAL